MAIISTSDLPAVTQLGQKANDQLKFHILSMLGHPVVNVEIVEAQMESILRSTHDFIATYFPLEEKYAFFYTTPFEPEYTIPNDAYWIYEVAWHPGTTNIQDVFSIDYILFNAANITGYQNLVSDFEMIREYQKFANRMFGLDGKWEFLLANNAIKLYPVPKGTFPVIVRYVPIFTQFKSPQSREIAYRVMVARAKEMVGAARRKYGSIPGPDGSSVASDGEALVSEGKEEYKAACEDAIKLGEPLRPYFG